MASARSGQLTPDSAGWGQIRACKSENGTAWTAPRSVVPKRACLSVKAHVTKSGQEGDDLAGRNGRGNLKRESPWSECRRNEKAPRERLCRAYVESSLGAQCKCLRQRFFLPNFFFVDQFRAKAYHQFLLHRSRINNPLLSTLHAAASSLNQYSWITPKAPDLELHRLRPLLSSMRTMLRSCHLRTLRRSVTTMTRPLRLTTTT